MSDSRQFAPFAPRPATRYATLARTLLAEIEAGHYAVGAQLPTESELCERFAVSRHTVRQALRELRDLGVVSPRQGVGTLVRAQTGMPRLIQTTNSVEDLLQITRQTRQRVIAQREVIADAELAELLPCPQGQQWTKLSILRYLPGHAIPVAHLTVYIRPEFAGIIPNIDTDDRPIFRQIEHSYGERLATIDQEITSIALGEKEAKAVEAEPGTNALQMLRRFFNDQDRLLQTTIGHYPGGRFTHTARFRLTRPETA